MSERVIIIIITYFPYIVCFLRDAFFLVFFCFVLFVLFFGVFCLFFISLFSLLWFCVFVFGWMVLLSAFSFTSKHVMTSACLLIGEGMEHR